MSSSSSSTGVLVEFDPLNDIGLSHAGKMVYWEEYVTALIVSIILNILVMIVVFQLPKKSASDILAGGLCFTAFVFAGTCGTQCFINMVLGHFGFGRPACYAEALSHMITIETMFILLSTMAYDSYRTVAFGNSIGVKNACWVVLGAWIFNALGIGLFSIISPIYMAPAGLFCFFEFDSPVMYAFFLPSFVIASSVMAYYYFQIFKITRAAMAQLGEFVTNQEYRKRVQMRLAQKLFLFVLVFVTCWTVTIIGIIFVLATGDMQKLDAVGGIFGTLHSLLVPVAYGVINPRLRVHLLALVTCGRFGSQSRSTPKDEIQSKTDQIELSQQLTHKSLGRASTTARRPSIVSGGAQPIHPSSSVASTTLPIDKQAEGSPQPSSSIEPPAAAADSGQVTVEMISYGATTVNADQFQSSASDSPGFAPGDSLIASAEPEPIEPPSNAVVIHMEVNSLAPALQ